MEVTNSRSVTSNQDDIHEKLEDIVTTHLRAPFLKPIASHTKTAFEAVKKHVDAFTGPLVFDSCCGVGESTANIAKQHPQALVIGIDKSSHRLNKHNVEYRQSEFGQYLLVRADLNDFWRLAVEAGWQLSHHYLLYPNPWPKAKHIKRRWHGGSVFPYILKLGGQLEVRSNWSTYVEEFAYALTLAGFPTSAEPYESNEPITPFERKYWGSGQSSTRLTRML
ncbi:tRNA (guanine(46)-N(7))-methyltransferase TrmB [Pseudoalteromonas xiamenensis]